MKSRFRAVLVGFLALSVCLQAAAQSIDAARAARDRAKADLIRAQEAFDRADDAYIKALGGAAAAPGVAPAPTPPAAVPSGTRPRTVTFSLSGPGAVDINPLDYRGRVILDGQPGAWTEHAAGARNMVPAEVRSLAYEVQKNDGRNTLKPEWNTICKGDLPLKNATVDIAIARKIACYVR